jgi:hypothetical protein
VLTPPRNRRLPLPPSPLFRAYPTRWQHLQAVFGIGPIRELATNKSVLGAQAINVPAKLRADDEAGTLVTGGGGGL